MALKKSAEMTLKLEEGDKEKLRKLAAENDRTMQAEVRRAIHLYLEGQSA